MAEKIELREKIAEMIDPDSLSDKDIKFELFEGVLSS